MDKKKKFKYMFMIWTAILIVGLVKKTLQNDTFYTIKIGELILNNGIDMMDHFSFHTGLKYTYPHWLYDVFIYLIYHGFGYVGIYISSIILLLLLLMVVFKTNIKITNNYSISALGTFLCTLAIASFAVARAQLVSFILFAMEIYFIESFLKSGKKRNLVGLVLISLLLCNIHVAVWPFYFILYLPYLAEYLVAVIGKRVKIKDNKLVRFVKSRIIVEENKYIKELFLVMILSLLTGFLTPIGLTPYTYFIRTAMGNSQKYIMEHQMMSWISSPFTIIIAFETLFFAIVAKAKLRDLFMECGLIIMSIISVRHIALLALIGTICFVRIFNMFLDEFNFNGDEKIINFFNKRIVIVVSFIIVMIGSTLLFKYQNSKEYVDSNMYPVEAVKYIKDNVDINEMHLFNEYNFGSYLLLNDIPVFIDSRADLYTMQFSGLDYDILDDWHNIPINYQEMFEFYDITHVLIYRKDNAFYQMLENDDGYDKLYKDDNFGLFKKTNKLNFMISIKNKN